MIKLLTPESFESEPDSSGSSLIRDFYSSTFSLSLALWKESLVSHQLLVVKLKIYLAFGTSI